MILLCHDPKLSIWLADLLLCAVLISRLLDETGKRRGG